MKWVLFTLLAAACAQGAIAAPVAPDTTADLVLKSGAVYTVDGARTWAQAVAIRAGHIVFVGTDKDVTPFVTPSTRVIDLKGRMVLPAFQDVHIHPITAGIEANSCSLGGLKTATEYVAAIKKCADAHPSEPWITGGGWLMSAFGPGGLARRELIDAVVPDRPVFLSSADGHTSWANTKALELAKITDQTPDPPDGRIDRDSKTRVAIGSLQEGAADLVSAVIPLATAEQHEAGLRFAIKVLNGYGVTAIQDASVYEDDLKAYRALDGRGELSLKVVAAIWWERRLGLEQIDKIKRLRTEYSTGRIDANTVKIMQDGVMENYTAVLLKPYLKKPGNVRGIPMVEPVLLKDAVTRLDAAGFQVHFHAIGDGAVRQSLDAIEQARRLNGDLGHRHHIAHLELVDPADVPRFRELGVIANFQPLWAFADEYITNLTIPFLGPERSSRLYPIGTLYHSGAVVAFGSDWSVSSPNPLEEIQVAVTRMGPAGETQTPFLPEERISLPEALAAFTINAAYTNRLEKTTGSLEPGKSADLIVLDRNLFAIAPTEIAKADVLVTLFEGRAVHGNLATLAETIAPSLPTAPTRPANGPGAPKWTVAVVNAPVDHTGDFLIGPGYRPAPESNVMGNRPVGTVRQFTLESKDSHLYPGIARDAFGTVDPNNPSTLLVQTRPQPWQRAITVYVPGQYKGGTMAPFIVVHDGPKLGEPDMTLARVLDNLIAQRRVPPLIAVMIQNGGGDAQGSERGLEYDTLSGKFAEFIESEVLPQVEANYQVRLTHDPNGRAAMGCSSGAAAAFTMAWFHPEWYHRVISYSGTFVNQQWPFNPGNPGGAWDYHETLIQSAERKPIRIWMQVGDRDLLNPNVLRDDMHDWVVANHRMAAALKAKGYQYQYVFAQDSAHCDRRVREQTLPQALEWVWRGYEPERR